MKYEKENLAKYKKKKKKRVGPAFQSQKVATVECGIKYYVTRDKSRFFSWVLLPERQDFSRGCVYCPSKARAVNAPS